MVICLTLTKFSRPHSPSSRPNPLLLFPPHGACRTAQRHGLGCGMEGRCPEAEAQVYTGPSRTNHVCFGCIVLRYVCMYAVMFAYVCMQLCMYIVHQHPMIYSAPKPHYFFSGAYGRKRCHSGSTPGNPNKCPPQQLRSPWSLCALMSPPARQL